MTNLLPNRRRSLYFTAIGVILLGIIQLIPMVSADSNALKDASLQASGQPQVMDLDGTNWVIIRNSLSWGDSSSYCDKNYFRLTMLPSKEKAQELVEKIASISVKYSPDYDKKYKEVEFGMDRRYWIGLTDQLHEGNWHWTHNGSELTYQFWYPNQPDHQKLPDNNIKSAEHCVTLWNPGYYGGKDKHSFNDEDCVRKHYAICDKTG